LPRILKIILVLLCPALLAVSSFAQQAGHPSLTLMSLSAHPDDEGGGTLAYYGKLKGVSTFSIYFTRGEGGQNEIGSELYEDLGILRTRETLEAAKILGAEAHFLGFRDFGFSKTAKETFSMWGGKDSVLARLVYVIRALKPDVIITNHDTVTTKPNRQHGNHQAVGISAYQAFEKASDPSYHPEQRSSPPSSCCHRCPAKRFHRRIHVRRGCCSAAETSLPGNAAAIPEPTVLSSPAK